MPPSRRMTKEQRRRHLKQAALDIVREEGVEALTLARAAERAGVTKPIAYEHFGTRAGLLIALFQDYDVPTHDAFQSALKARGKTLQDAASIFSTSYVDSCLEMGPEIAAVFSALAVCSETQDFLQTWRGSLIDEACAAFAVFTPNEARRRTLMIGILGAAEALAAAVWAKLISRDEAVISLARIITATLSNAMSMKHNEISIT
jgi:AcrR family transcriptional regulator